MSTTGVVTLSQTERNLPTIANVDARDFSDLACWLIVQIGPISLNVTTPLEYLREGDTLLVTKIDRLARSTSDLYRIVSTLADKGVAFKVVDDPTINTTSRTGKLIMGILALIAEFENDIRRERQMDGIKKARERGTRFGRKPLLIAEMIQRVRKLRKVGTTVPEIMRQTCLSKASVYRAL